MVKHDVASTSGTLIKLVQKMSSHYPISTCWLTSLLVLQCFPSWTDSVATTRSRWTDQTPRRPLSEHPQATSTTRSCPLAWKCRRNLSTRHDCHLSWYATWVPRGLHRWHRSQVKESVPAHWWSPESLHSMPQIQAQNESLEVCIRGILRKILGIHSPSQRHRPRSDQNKSNRRHGAP